MTFKIERVLTPTGCVVFRMSGRIDDARVNVLLESIENERMSNTKLALDLKDATVVSLEAVRALAVLEAAGIELQNCPAYIREWIFREMERELPD